MKSIRHRLLFWLASVLILVTILVSFIIYSLTLNGFNHVRNFALEQVALALSHHASGSKGTTAPTENPNQYTTQIWDKRGALRYTSRPEIDLPRQGAGFHRLEWLEEDWHIYTLVSDETTIQVANTTANRAVMYSEITRGLLIPLGFLIGFLACLLWIAVDEAIRPLDGIRREISRLDVAQLRTLPLEDYPSEIAPLVATLDHLLERLDLVLNSQRRFIADAAHELRTPLTAIGLQTEIALASKDESDRREALEMLKVSVDRASRLIAQLMQLARFDPETRSNINKMPVPLDDMVRRAVAEFSVVAESRGIDLGAGRCDPVKIYANADAIRVLLDNLIDNAIRYGRPGGRIDIVVVATGRAAILRVIDDGPGIPDEGKGTAFERFRRLAKADITGSGLGLAIVNEIVLDHRGRIALSDTPNGGLTVCVEFPQDSTEETT